jgi:phosphonate transport system substrate-binding protein
VRVGSLVPAILLTVFAVAAGATAMWFFTIRNPVRATEEETRARLMHMTGLARPVSNRLNERFTDSDGDMVADPPSDPAKLVDPPTLTFCYVAVEEPAEYERQWQPFCDHLSKVTGKPVRYLPLKSSEDQLRALRDGELQVTGFNSGSVPFAVNACGYVPVARVPTNDEKGTQVQIIVPADSSVRSPSDLSGKRYLALTEPNSNSGFKAPLVLLRAFDREPERDYLIRTTGDHRASIEGIAGKRYEAAAVSADILAREEAHGRIRKGDYRTVYTSESFPSAAVGYAHNLAPALAAKVREAIESFDMKGTALEAEFAPMLKTTFVPVNYKNDWALIRRIDDACGHLHELPPVGAGSPHSGSATSAPPTEAQSKPD